MTSTDEQEAHRAEYERLQNSLKNHPGKKADQSMADVQRPFDPGTSGLSSLELCFITAKLTRICRTN